MIGILFAVVFLVLTFALNLMVMAKNIKRLSKEIDDTKEKLEFHRIKLQYVESCELDSEHRIDQLEDMLELKERFDKEKGEHNGNND